MTISLNGAHKTLTELRDLIQPPKLTVERRDDGFYLTVPRVNQVAIDGEPVRDERRLEEGNRIHLGDVTGVFHERTNLKHG